MRFGKATCLGRTVELKERLGSAVSTSRREAFLDNGDLTAQLRGVYQIGDV